MVKKILLLDYGGVFNNDERIIKIVVRFSLKYLGSNI